MSRSPIQSFLLGIAVAAAFLYLAFRHVPLAEVGRVLATADWRWIGLAAGVSLLIQIFRAWRWQLELRPLAAVPLGRLWVVTSVAYMAINLLPVRTGEVVRPWLLSRRAPVSFSNVVGTLVVEKTMDAVVIFLYVLAGLGAAPTLPPWVRRGALVPAAAAGVLVVLVLLFWRHGETLAAERLSRRLPRRVAATVNRVVRAVLAGMRVIPDRRLLLTVFLVSVALWALPVLSSYIMFQAFDLAVPPSAALIVFVFIGFGTALPNAPGMVGTYQYACILALDLFGVPKSTALAYGIALNALQLGTLVLQGSIALPLARIGLQDLWRAREEPPPLPGGRRG